MTGLVVNVGSVPYADDALSVIRDFFDFNQIPLVVIDKDLEQNFHKSHPSWLKMFCHEIVDDDFVLCWDLDLVPDRRYLISEFIKDKSKFHIGIEMGLLYGFGMHNYGNKFKYNCGFMGVPKSFHTVFKQLYHDHGVSRRDCWEQLWVNDYLVDNDIDVQVIRPEYNCSISPAGEFLPNARNKHYTYGVMDSWERAKLIKKHKEEYFQRYGLNP